MHKKSGPSKLNLLTRRDFVVVITSIVIFSFFGLRLIAGLYFRRFANSYRLNKLSKVSKNTLIDLFPIMTNEVNPKKIDHALKEINNYVIHLGPRTRFELELALMFFNQATLLRGNFAPFPYLSLEKKLDYLHYLSQGPRIFAPIFLGLKEVCFLGYYSIEENFQQIPNYQPMVGKNGDADPEFNQIYEELKVSP